MRNFFRRFAAAFLAGSMLFAMTACSGGKEDGLADQTVMTVNGQEVPAGEYAANYLYSKATIETVMSQYGVSDLWNSDFAESYKEQLSDVARSQTASLYLIPKQFEAAGLSLTKEEEDSAKEPNPIMAPQLTSWGFTDALTERLARYFLMLEKLDAHYFGEGGVMSPGEDEIEDYFQQNYYRAKHILVSTRDENNQPITDEEQLAAIERKAQELYQRAAGGEDFDALIAEYGEDPGMSSNPDGYQFTNGTMVAEFQDGTAALGFNEISAPVQSDYGWHIILRLPLLESKRSEVHSDIVTALTGMDMDRLLEQWIGEATIENAPLLADITFENVDSYKYDVS